MLHAVTMSLVLGNLNLKIGFGRYTTADIVLEISRLSVTVE